MSDPAILQSTRSGAVYRLGRAFRIGGCLAHEAQDEQGRRYWIKQVQSSDEEGIARLRYEAIILDKLAHPRVVRALDRGRNHTYFFLALDPLPGHALPHLMEGGPPPIGFVLTIAAQIAELLIYLHSQGIICCTLAPDTLYVDHLGHTALVDLSAAWDEVSPPRAGIAIGSARYLSPEQAGGSAAERRSDIYSYGVLLFELLAGRPPFQGANRGDLALQHLLTPPPDLLELRPDIPPDLAALVTRCLAKSPANRYPSANALLNALRSLNRPAEAAPPAQEPAGRWRRWLRQFAGNEARFVDQQGHVKVEQRR